MNKIKCNVKVIYKNKRESREFKGIEEISMCPFSKNFYLWYNKSNNRYSIKIEEIMSILIADIEVMKLT